jgi:hypothetical protein
MQLLGSIEFREQDVVTVTTSTCSAATSKMSPWISTSIRLFD